VNFKQRKLLNTVEIHRDI